MNNLMIHGSILVIIKVARARNINLIDSKSYPITMGSDVLNEKWFTVSAGDLQYGKNLLSRSRLEYQSEFHH